MSGGYLTNPIIFIVDTIGSIYILIIMLRFLLQLMKADFYNPLSQFIVKATQPVLRPMRKVIPGFGGIDVASIIFALVAQLVLTTALSLIANGVVPPAGALLFLAIHDLVGLVFNIYLVGIFILVIISWVNPGSYNPIIGVINSLIDPVVAPFRRLIPPMGGFDFSIMVAAMTIVVLRMLVLPPILAIARAFYG